MFHHLVICIQLIWKRALSKHFLSFITQPSCLDCLSNELLYDATNSLTQRCSAPAASMPGDSRTLATSDTLPHKMSPPVRSASSYKWLRMFFPSAAPHRDVSWHPGDNVNQTWFPYICLHLKLGSWDNGRHAIFNLVLLPESNIYSDKGHELGSRINHNSNLKISNGSAEFYSLSPRRA